METLMSALGMEPYEMLMGLATMAFSWWVLFGRKDENEEGGV